MADHDQIPAAPTTPTTPTAPTAPTAGGTGGAPKYPLRTVVSFQCGALISLMMNQVFTQQAQTYYQTVVHLDVGLFTLAFVLYTAWNMFNDPLVGHLCDRSRRFTRRFGKRYPFILLGAIPFAFTVLLVFSAPDARVAGQATTFAWLLGTICLYDLCFSLFDTNRMALFPDKFRDETQRQQAGTWRAVLETLGILLGVVVPVVTVDLLGDETGWWVQGAVMAALCLLFTALMVPGIREGAELRARRARVDAWFAPAPEKPVEPPEIPEKPPEKRARGLEGPVEPPAPRPGFFAGMHRVLRHRNFLGYLCLYLAYSATMGLMIASMPFFVADILQLPKMGELILVGYIAAVPVSAPLWYKVARKQGARKVARAGGILLACMGLPLLLVPTGPAGLAPTIVVFVAGGLVDGAVITASLALYGAVIDEAAVTTGARQEGLYNGVFVFFQRLGIALRVVVFWLVQATSGYDPAAATHATAGLWGLRVQVSLVPVVVMGAGVALFGWLNDLTPAKVARVEARLRALDL